MSRRFCRMVQPDASRTGGRFNVNATVVVSCRRYFIANLQVGLHSPRHSTRSEVDCGRMILRSGLPASR